MRSSWLISLGVFSVAGCESSSESTDTRPERRPPLSENDEQPVEDTGDSGEAASDEYGSKVVAWNPPADLACGESGQAVVIMRNTGTLAWTREDGFKLGAVSDSDPFYGPDTRVWLPEGTVVAPGDSWSFFIDMVAPDSAGNYTTDWQMVHENVRWFGESVSAEVPVECSDQSSTGGWVEEACARNGSEICDDEVFGVDSGVRYGLLCSQATGGISFISSNTGPQQSDGMNRCQGWEDRGQNAWDHLDYIANEVCSVEGTVVEVDLSAYAGGDLWFGSHDHPNGGGHMTSTCLVTWEE